MARRKADVSDMEFTQSTPFSYQGEDIQPDEREDIPSGRRPHLWCSIMEHTLPSPLQ